MDELEVPGENDAVWDFRVSVDFLVSARDMIEARSLVSRALNAEASDGTPFVTRDHRLIEDGRSWGVSDWQPVPPRPSQAALVQEKYPGLINDVAVVDGIGALLGSHAPAAGALPRQTLERIQQAFADYRRTGFGGWPWDRPDPVHGRDAGRFAQHADGRIESRG